MIPVNAQALLVRAHERPVEGRVARVRGNHAEIAVAVLPLDAERRWSRGLFVEYAIDTGVYRAHACLRAIDRRDGGYAVDVQVTEHPVLLLTRQYVRAPVALPLSVKRGDLWTPTQTVDVGGGGVRLPFEIGYEIGDPITLEFDMVPPYGVIRASGRVVREAADGSVGIAFTSIEDDARSALMAIAFAHLRSTRRREIEPSVV